MADWAELVYTVLEVLIAVACCLGNLLVIWAVWTCGATRRQPTFCFVVSLAVADFLVGAVGVPMAVLVDGRFRISFYSCMVLSSLLIVLTQASVHSLLAIALDLFLRVHIPLRYQTLVTRQRSWWVVVVCWITAYLLSSTPLLSWTQQPANSSNSSNSSAEPICEFMNVIPIPYMVYFNFPCCILFPLLCTSALYTCIFHQIRKQLYIRDVMSRGYYQKERHLAKPLLLVQVLFMVCWLPIHLINVALLVKVKVPQGVVYVGILLSHANSAVNPVVYSFKMPRIQKAYRQIWRRYVLGSGKQEPSSSTLDSTYSKMLSSKDTNL